MQLAFRHAVTAIGNLTKQRLGLAVVVVTEPSGLVDELSDLTVVEDELLPPLPDAPPDLADAEPDTEELDEDAMDEVPEDDATANDAEFVCVCTVCWSKQVAAVEPTLLIDFIAILYWL